MGKTASYAAAYNDYYKYYRISVREEKARLALEDQQYEEELEYQRKVLSGHDPFATASRASADRSWPGEKESIARRNKAIKEDRDRRREEAIRTYGISDLRKLPKAGGALKARKQDRARSIRELNAAARKRASQARAANARAEKKRIRG